MNLEKVVDIPQASVTFAPSAMDVPKWVGTIRGRIQEEIRQMSRSGWFEEDTLTTQVLAFGDEEEEEEDGDLGDLTDDDEDWDEDDWDDDDDLDDDDRRR